MGFPNRENVSADDFINWIEHQDHRHELVDGRIVRMMAGAKQSHNVVTSNIVVALTPDAKRKNCRTTSSDTAVRTGPNGIRYPDVVIDCGPRDASAREATRPTIVVEVSSPRTSEIDVSDKLDEYKAHDDIRAILLVDPDVVSVKVYRRQVDGTWDVERYKTLADRVPLPEIDTSLRLGDIYDTLDPKERPRMEIVQE